MTRPNGDGEQLISAGQVKIDGKWRSIKQDGLVQLPSGTWVLPKSPEAIEYLAKMAERHPRETPETAKRPLADERDGEGKHLGNSGNSSLEELEERAAPILAMADPLIRFEESVRGVGFGGQNETRHYRLPGRYQPRPGYGYGQYASTYRDSRLYFNR